MTDSVVDGVSHKGKKLKKDMAEALRKDEGQMTTGDIAEEIDASTSSVSKYKDELIEEGVIKVECGKGPNPDKYEYLSGEASLYDIDIGL
jgi:predicted transcriptional regulator